jgi:hypothetical protein
MVFGLADSEAVGAVAKGGGGGGGATFLWHAPRRTIAPSTNTSVLHLIIVIIFLLLIECFTEFLLLCARILACNLQLDGRAHRSQPQENCAY